MVKSEYTSGCPGTDATLELFNACQTGMATLVRYTNAHTTPLLIATNYFNRVESQRFWTRTPIENLMAYLKIGTMNLEMAGRAREHYLFLPRNRMKIKEKMINRCNNWP
jgi:hypothetical protein